MMSELINLDIKAVTHKKQAQKDANALALQGA
jgi:hypothetical protein